MQSKRACSDPHRVTVRLLIRSWSTGVMFSVTLMVLLWAYGPVFPAAGAGDKQVYGDRFVGDGVRFRRADWGDDLYPINVNNSWGHISRRGDLLVFPRYDWADDSHGEVGWRGSCSGAGRALSMTAAAFRSIRFMFMPIDSKRNWRSSATDGILDS